ncbi:universal stress protein [Marilutibacter chinensis]|uniref:Universal stress protein n=1 Tax=Marilutibacter chinensis TaxID=2912247 RepID=A0ABS9HP44_9GAMM|nr:universal stress protein [Lysobacter chinensis]MCF7220348.1 universal stress protein [Lysobacter chinensis]
MIKDLMLALTGTDADDNALDNALAMADYAQAHLTVVGTVRLLVPAVGDWGVAPDASSMQLIHAEIRAMAEAQATRLRERLARESVPSEVRMVETMSYDPQRECALHARYTDLVMMTADGGGRGESASVNAFFSSILLESGRPVIVVPPSHRMRVPPRHVVVAWRPTREASRALHEAMPFLRAADSVDVLEIESGPDERSDDGPQPGADIATHLARHGLKVRVVVRQRRDEAVSTALLDHCEQSGAQLLVAGGYGHSRLREWMIGGTTRELLQFARLPVLFSH